MGTADADTKGQIASTTTVKGLLQALDLGNSVAEFDSALERYFVETETFRALVRGQKDIVAGDKGTGKTALYRILSKRFGSIAELKSTEIVAAFNPSGEAVFQRLVEAPLKEEGEYITFWKGYFLSLVGNWVLKLYEDEFTDAMFELDQLLRSVGLRSVDDTPRTVFSQIVNLFRRLKSIEVTFSVSPQGLPLVVPKIEFETIHTPEPDEPQIIRHDDAFGLLNRVLDEIDLSIWLVLDRLDEAFQGFPTTEVPALRALLRTYLDLAPFKRVTLKLFVRKDLFRRIIQGGFVNLTHVNARKIEIVWDEEDLLDLLYRRISENSQFVSMLDLAGKSPNDVFYRIFPPKVDMAERKPRTWNWMMTRIRDGNNVRPPRNLIDLVKKAQEAQLRREERSQTAYVGGAPIIGSDALKSGLAMLSKERVEDTLLAEAGELAQVIDKFRDGKAEHDQTTIARLLSLTVEEAATTIKALVEMGFLEQVGSGYKVPMLYRQGLAITQGKAFEAQAETDEEDES